MTGQLQPIIRRPTKAMEVAGDDPSLAGEGIDASDSPVATPRLASRESGSPLDHRLLEGAHAPQLRPRTQHLPPRITAPSLADAWSIRPAEPAERKWVAGSWSRVLIRRPDDERKSLSSFEHRGGRYLQLGPRHAGVGVDLATWTLMGHTLVNALLEACTLDVACDPEQPDEPVGWVAFDPAAKRVHCVYVREYARKGGVGFTLARHAFTACGAPALVAVTHLTPAGSILLDKLAAVGLVQREADRGRPRETKAPPVR